MRTMPSKWRKWPLQSRLGYYTAQDWSNDDACWNFTGPLTVGGYGQLMFGGELRLAHRVAWELANGSIPVGKVVLHKQKCDNRRCVRPSHLELGKRRSPFETDSVRAVGDSTVDD